MSSGHSSSSSPSQHERSEVVYHDRGIWQQEVVWQDPPPLTESSRGFLQAVMKASGFPHSDADVSVTKADLKKLRLKLNAVYLNEELFDTALFGSLKGFLKDYTIKYADENCIILGNETTIEAASSEYAVGFVRQKCVALDLCRSREGKVPGVGANKCTLTGMSSLSKVDHAVCLFQRAENKKWAVVDCFGFVEIKMSNSNCTDFVVDEINDITKVAKDGIDLGTHHGALGQAIGYTIGCVYLSYARRGKLKGRKELPLAIVAGRKGNPEESDRLRWVAGRLRFPEVGGGRFFYTVENFGRFFAKKSRKEQTSVETALSLYFDTLRDGLNVAIEVRDEFIAKMLTSPDPPSGMQLRLGNENLALQYCASPIRGANAIQGIENESWRVSQGDLFRGRLDIGAIRKLKMSKIFFVPRTLGEADVLVKVSSTIAHTTLVHPSMALHALKTILLEGQDVDEALEDVLNGLLHEIGTVLYAAFATEVGMVSIMADLTKANYGPLKPESHTDNLAMLWSGFSELVRNVLLPMAVITEIVHTDIRPGFDETSNIMWKFDSATKRANMKLIDYESLVEYQKWSSDKLDQRYIRTDPTWDATTFLWWQCATVAFVWKMQLLQREIRKNEGRGRKMAALRNAVLNGDQLLLPWLMCLHKIYHDQNVTGVDRLNATLDFLSKWFDGTDDSYFKGMLDKK